MTKQKKVFLVSEGNAYFERNRKYIENKEYGLEDPIIRALSKCLNKQSTTKKKLLEIGCGEAKRLSWISKNFKIQCFGVEPSKKAVALANINNVKAIQGTADSLDFKDNKFDFVVFGFCLYLCDRSDLFKIAKEADRVLKDNGYLIIRDFFSNNNTKNKYHHASGLFTYKMDYRKLFDWHPNYNCFYHEVSNHKLGGFTENKSDWVATSIIKKNLGE